MRLRQCPAEKQRQRRAEDAERALALRSFRECARDQRQGGRRDQRGAGADEAAALDLAPDQPADEEAEQERGRGEDDRDDGRNLRSDAG